MKACKIPRMYWIHPHIHLLFGLFADGLTFAGAVILARDAFLRLSSLRRDRVDERFRREFPRLNLTDDELKAARRAMRWTFTGSLLLVLGFFCQIVLRFQEK